MITGIGLGYLPCFREEVRGLKDKFSFLEIRPEDYFYEKSLCELKELKESWSLTLHGTEMSFLSKDDHSEYLNELKKVIEFSDAPWASEHLSWLSIGEKKIDAYIHPFVEVGAAKLCFEKARNYGRKIGVPFHLENVANFVNDSLSQREEHDFYSKVFSTNDCKMIFNLNSFLITSFIRGIALEDYLFHFPLNHIESITFVPLTCGNVIIEQEFGDYIMQNYEKALALVLKNSSANSVLIQRRYPHNTYESLRDIVNNVSKIYQESCYVY